MKPYYEDASVALYHGDQRELLPALRGSGLVVSDPPYNIGYKYGTYRDQLEDAAYVEMIGTVIDGGPTVLSQYPEAFFAWARRPVKCVAWVYHAHVGPSWRMVGWFGLKPQFDLDPEPYRNPDDKRVAALMHRSPGRPRRDWWPIEQVKNVSKDANQHPCPVPLPLISRILAVTPEPSVVIDPFAGSGTTLRAAKDVGRQAIGIEIDERYCEIAARRMCQEVLAL